MFAYPSAIFSRGIFLSIAKASPTLRARLVKITNSSFYLEDMQFREIAFC